MSAVQFDQLIINVAISLGVLWLPACIQDLAFIQNPASVNLYKSPWPQGIIGT